MAGMKARTAALLDFFRVNRRFAILVCCETAILLLLLCRALFTPLQSLSVSPSDFYVDGWTGVQLTEAPGLILQENEGAPDGYDMNRGPYSMRSGGYEVTVRYRSDVDGAGDVNNAAAKILFRSMSQISASELPLDDAHIEATGRVYLPFVSKASDLYVIIQYDGKGTLELYGMEFQESGLYRAMGLLGFVLLFAVIDLLIYIFLVCGRRWKREWNIALVLIGIILFASIPYFANFLVLGHDLVFHLARIAAVADELKNGQFPVRMLTTMCNEYGYANSLYYCDIFLYLPAILYNCMLPLRLCYQIYVILVNTATCLFAFYAFQRMTGSRKFGLMGAALYTLSLYRLINVVLRAAVGEYTAMTFFPLVILGMYQIYTEDKPQIRDWMPLALGMSGIIMCHVLSVEMAVIFLLLFCVFHPVKTLDTTRLLALVKAVLVCILLTAWYVVPFLESMLLQKTHIAVYDSNIQKSGLYPVQVFGLFSPGTGIDVINGLQNEMPLALGPALTLGMICVLYVLFHRDAWELEGKPRFWACREIFILALISIIFTLWCFPWAGIQVNLPMLARFVSVVQFPWRFLSTASALLIPAILFALAEWGLHDRRMAQAVSLTLCAIAIVGTGFFFHNSTNDGYGLPAIFQNHREMTEISDGLYLPENAQLSYVMQAEEISGSAEFHYEKERGVGYLQVDQTDSQGAVIEVPIFSYWNYWAKDSASGATLPISESAGGQIAVVLPGGYQGTVEIRYIPPFYWHIAELISLVSLVALTLLYVLRKGRKLNP